MKKLALPASFLSLLGLTLAFAPAPDQHPSKVSEVLATYSPREVESRDSATLVRAAEAFLESLDDELRGECLFPLDSPERQEWTNVPPGADEGGARLGDMSAEQLKRACDLLATVLSRQGYQRARDILLADDRLLRNGQPRRGFGAENYWLVLFGTPSTTGTWALQLDGHHIAINLTFSGEDVCMSPSFIGTQPSAYDRDGDEITPLKGGIDAAFALVGSLSEEQRKKAILGAKRGRIAAGAGRDGVIPEPTGVRCSSFGEEQRELLAELLREYVGDLPEPHAAKRLAALVAEIDDMVFAWNGPTDNPSDVSYRVQGPTVIVEYACQDLGGRPLDHLHSMYRNPKNEYGAAFSKDR